jgi:predicted acyltransferase
MRFASVDALRGIAVAAMLVVNDPGDWGHVYPPLLHAEWHGCTPTDLIFPLFLFVVGISADLALTPRVDRGDARGALARAVLARAARILALGLLLNVLAWWAFDQPQFRVMGVLQRIALCYGAAGLVAVFVRARTHWMLLAALLLGYAALLAWGGSYAPFDNLASRIDSAVFGAHVYQLEPGTARGHDPEGLLSTLGALATTVFGLRAGAWLRRGALSQLWLAAAAAAALGYAWTAFLPLNKNLWTQSYVLWTGGIACALVALAHLLVDRRGWPAWGRAFGVNAIAAYAGSALLVYVLVVAGWLAPVYRHGFADWMTPRFGPYLPSLAFALAFTALWWGVVRVLDARRIRFRI